MKLIFVYNADSGALNTILDSMHKIVSPDTYDCNLCAITFGKFTEDSLWKAFREKGQREMIFLHRDEFLKQYASKWLPNYDFPIVLIENDGELEVFITNDILNTLNSSEALIEEVTKRADQY